MHKRPTYKELEKRIEALENASKRAYHLGNVIFENEEIARALLDSLTVAFMIYQGNHWVSANKAAETITGYSMSELFSMNMWEFIHIEDKGLVEIFDQK